MRYQNVFPSLINVWVKAWAVFLGWVLCGVLISAWAVTDAKVQLDPSPHDIHNQASILRGGEHFKNNCISCHSLRLARNNAVLRSLGITQEMMPVWPKDSWGGHPPPDLSLMAAQMGSDWIYTYLHAYYQDPNRPTGYNNLIYPNTNMPNPFVQTQGVQVLAYPGVLDREDLSDMHWYQVIKLQSQGDLSPALFDNYVADLVNFLTFIADPSVEERYALAPWVLGYLLLMAVASAWVFRLLKKDLWTRKPPK